MLFRTKIYRLFITACCCTAVLTCCAHMANGQDTSAIKKLIHTAEDYQSRLQGEKLYLHFDRPYYTTYDTIWFKAYLFNSATYTPSRLSSKVYVELINDSSRVLNRFAIAMETGLGEGHIVLNEAVTDGTYTVRAYTNWMQNFGDDVFFSKQFYVGKPSGQGSWLISEQHKLTALPGGSQVNLALQLTTLAKAVVPYRDIELRLLDGKKTLFKGNYLTTDGGNATATFNLSLKTDTRNLALVVTDKNTKNKYTLPFYPGGQMQNIDLQFMPEGGNLVAGLTSKVGFKAIGEDGLGTAIKGIITDQDGKEVSNFQTTHNGMGSFLLVPQENQIYTAKFELNGVMHLVPLPLAKPGGIILKIDNLHGTDSVYVYIRATPDVAAQSSTYHLMVQSAGSVYMGISFKLVKGFYYFHLPKINFTSGITSFTLLDASGHALSQRRIFIDHHDRLNLEIAPMQTNYKPKDSIALHLNVCNALGRPVVGSFSVAVTDDSFINDNPEADNLVSHLLLKSETKGYVENPGWYFRGDSSTESALDNLMLTQGWTGFDWMKALLPPATPQFKSEPNNRLTGNLRNLFNKPVKDAKLSLFSISKKYGLMLLDTISDAKGEFAFENLPLLDTIAYTLRVNNKKDKASTATVNLDLFEPSAITGNGIRLRPWFANLIDSSMLEYFNRPQAPRYNGIDVSEVKGTLLKEVKIKANKPSIVAERYSGFVTKEIFEKELVDAGKMTLYDLVARKVNNFGISSTFKEGIFSKVTYHEKPALVMGIYMVADIIVDGQGTTLFSENAEPPGDFPHPQAAIDFMKSIGADDVKNIKIAEGTQIFIVVTTRGGHGFFTKSSYNVLPYRPVPYCLPKQFYRPKYDVKNIAPVLPRPTVHWEPELITDDTGKATLSFYAADKPGIYTVIIEGTDMNGNFGRQTGKIVISKPVIVNKTNAAK